MFKTSEQTLRTNAPCECGQFEQRQLQLVSVPGYFATEDTCRKCKVTYLFVFKTDRTPRPATRFIKAVPITGRSEEEVRTALLRVPGINEHDVEFMLATARPAGGSNGTAPRL